MIHVNGAFLLTNKRFDLAQRYHYISLCYKLEYRLLEILNDTYFSFELRNQRLHYFFIIFISYKLKH